MRSEDTFYRFSSRTRGTLNPALSIPQNGASSISTGTTLFTKFQAGVDTATFLIPPGEGQSNITQPITLRLSGKVIPNRLYRTPLSEYASTYDEDDIEKTGIPKPRYIELYQGTNVPMVLNIFYDQGCNHPSPFIGSRSELADQIY